MNIDFTTARFKHMNWRFRIKAFLDGKETLTKEQAVSHTDCDLGKWFYSFGKAKYGHLPVIQEFEKLHIELHAQIAEILRLSEAGENERAQEVYAEMLSTSEKLMSCLDQAEKIFAIRA
jgi:methyl-accepting chemotaxis protein